MEAGLFQDDLHVVTFSGGKDSVATWLYLERELGRRVLCVMADTMWESQITTDYVPGKARPAVANCLRSRSRHLEK